MEFDNVIVRQVDFLPMSVKGVTIPDYDGYYNIYINAKYGIDIQNRTLKHELQHVENFDFENFDSIRLVESRADAQ